MLRIFMLRGIIRESGHWRPFDEQLKAAFPDAEFIFLDAPGNGVYHKVASPTSIPGMVDFMRNDYLKNTTTPATNLIFAISLGGMMAASWLERYPDDFKGAFIVNSSFAGVSPIFKRLKLNNFPNFLKIALAQDPRAKESAVLSMVANNEDRLPESIENWTMVQKIRPVSVGNMLRQAYAGATFRPKLDRPGIPVLVMKSTNDRLVSASCSDDIHKFWNTDLVTNETAGHDVTGDDPDWVISNMKTWLNEKGLS